MPDPSSGTRPEDLPWNDEPGGNLAFPGAAEPDPAGVEGDDLPAEEARSTS